MIHRVHRDHYESRNIIYYLAVLAPYKFSGYPMLIKTIQFEADDEQLFSKETSLLAAAAELTYHTINCSALNAEELRREKGLEVHECLMSLIKKKTL